MQLRALAEAHREGFTVPDECFAAGVECLSAHQSAAGDFKYMSGLGAGSFSCTTEALSALKHLGVTDGPLHENGWKAFGEYTDGSRERERSWFLYGNLFAVDAMGRLDNVTLVGEQTAGQMLSQKMFDVSHGLQIFLPIADYYSSESGRIEGVGIAPDVDVEAGSALIVALEMAEKDLVP